MIKIYHARRARSVRVVWLLEELGVPYQLEQVDFRQETLKSPDYLKLHPLGQIPVMQEDGVSMFESGAIVEYLLEKYGQGRLAPAQATPRRAEYLQWFHYGEASLARYMSDIVRKRFREQVRDDDPTLAGARARFVDSLVVVDRALAGREFICGPDFSAADIMVAYGIAMGRIVRELPAELTNVGAYLERLKPRPAYERAWSV